MSNFSKTIQTEKGIMNFYFNRVYTPDGARYHVSAMAKNNRAVICYMEQRGDEWHLVMRDANAPWLTEIENELSRAIREHRSGQTS